MVVEKKIERMQDDNGLQELLYVNIGLFAVLVLLLLIERVFSSRKQDSFVPPLSTKSNLPLSPLKQQQQHFNNYPISFALQVL